MPLLYGHPFAAFVWKPLIALYERGVAFEFRMVDPDHPENSARIATLSPTGQFPALVDGADEITGSNAIIEHLDLAYPGAPPMLSPDPKVALEARILAHVFDEYVATPMQRVVAEALRGADEKDPRGLADAHAALDKAYPWLDRRLASRAFAAGEAFTLADCAAAPALFYADWVRPISDDHATLKAYRARLLARPSVARVVDEARPYRHFFPLGAPDRD